jgi:hypothetical protein
MTVQWTLLASAAILFAIPGAAVAQWSSGSGGAIYYDGGSIGVGTASPQKQLHIGDVSVGNGEYISATAPSLILGNSDTYASATMYTVFALATAQGHYSLSAGDVLLGSYGSAHGNIYINSNFSLTGAITNVLLQPAGGNVGIGTTSPQHLLHVAGTIGAEQVIVSSTGADYVFDPNYKLAPLSEVASYVEANHHLPDIPSAEDMTKQGVSLGDMQTKLLAKVEELTLHMIQLEQQNRELQQKVERLESSGTKSNLRSQEEPAQ